MLAANDPPRTSNVTRAANLARCNAACPAEFAPADDAVHDVARLAGLGPCGECLLDLRVQPLVRVDPSLHNREVDAPQGCRALQRVEFVEGDGSVVLVHRHQQDAASARVQAICLFEELDATATRQMQVRDHQCDRITSGRQLLECFESTAGRLRRDHAIVGGQASKQGGLGRRAVLLVRVDDEQHRPPVTGLPRNIQRNQVPEQLGMLIGRCNSLVQLLSDGVTKSSVLRGPVERFDGASVTHPAVGSAPVQLTSGTQAPNEPTFCRTPKRTSLHPPRAPRPGHDHRRRMEQT